MEVTVRIELTKYGFANRPVSHSGTSPQTRNLKGCLRFTPGCGALSNRRVGHEDQNFNLIKLVRYRTTKSMMFKMRLAPLLVLLASTSQASDADRIQEGHAFLVTYAHSTSFDTDSAERLATDLDHYDCHGEIPVCNDALLVSSAIHGMLSGKLKANGGIAHLKVALANLNSVFATNQSNAESSIGYGTLMAALATQNAMNRFFIETALGINIRRDSLDAIRRMRLFRTTDDPSFKILANKYERN